MRQALILLLLLFLAVPGTAQVTWEKSFGSNNSDACQVVMTPDGGFAVLAYLGINATLIRTDSAGDTLWTRSLPPHDFCTILVTMDGGLISTGATRAADRDFIAYRMDVQGDSVWSKTYPDTLDQGHYAVVELDDGGFLLTGYTRTLNGSYDMYVLRTDILGDLIWTQTYGTPNQDLGAMPSLTKSGGYVFATTTNSTGPSQILVVTADAGGTPIWSQTYSAGPNSIGGAVPTALSDGGYLIMGWIDANNYNSYLIRLDSAGTVLWAKDYGGLGFETRTPRGAIEDIRGGYSFVTSTDLSYAPGPDRDIALVRVDTNGNLNEMVRIGGNGNEMPRYYQQLPDSGFIVTGFTSSIIPGVQQAYLARLAPSGCGDRFFDPGFLTRDTLCPDDTLLLDAGPGFVSYNWSNGATSSRIEVTVPDTYWVAALDSAGCLFYSTLVFVEAKPGPDFTFLDQGNLQVDFTATPANATGWSWDFGDGQSSTQQNPVHIYNQPGSYVVCLNADIPGCGRYSVCDTVILGTVGLASSVGADAVKVGIDADGRVMRVSVDVPDAFGNAVPLEIWSVSGGLVLQAEVAGSGRSSIDVSGLTKGLYVWRVVFGDRIFAGKVLVW